MVLGSNLYPEPLTRDLLLNWVSFVSVLVLGDLQLPQPQLSIPVGLAKMSSIHKTDFLLALVFGMCFRLQLHPLQYTYSHFNLASMKLGSDQTMQEGVLLT